MSFAKKGGRLQAEEHHPNREAWGWNHHVLESSCCGGALLQEGLVQIDGFMRQENYVDILKYHLKTSVRKLKLGRK
jgi:hypothetical protein